MFRQFLVACALSMMLAAPGFGAQRLGIEPVATGLDTPIFLCSPPGRPDTLIIPQLNGLILRLDGGDVQALPWADLRTDVSTESDDWGFYGFAFHPDYLSNGYFFVSYITNVGGPLRNDLVRFRVLGDPATATQADVTSRQLILSIPQPWEFHHGGAIAFGPDGYLYVISGDNDDHYSPQNYAQDLSNLYGKLLRIDVDGALPYTVPPDNPFVGVQNARPEIWAYGLRNPWRFSFDRQTGDMWIGDVGQWLTEEVNVQPASSTGGENYGWNVFEANRCITESYSQSVCNGLVADVTMPVVTYEHTGGNSITGGYVYRGSNLPAIQGQYFFGDFPQGRVWRYNPASAAPNSLTELTETLDPRGNRLGFVGSFGEDGHGELYVISFLGSIYRLAYAYDADTDGSFSLSLPELLRVIQIFNVGSFHCDSTTTDGFAPGPGAQSCGVYTVDRSGNWKLELAELLRAVQIFNIGAYRYCPDTASDPFCPGS